MFHSTCEIEVGSIEELHYYEFSNALREGDPARPGKRGRICFDGYGAERLGYSAVSVYMLAVGSGFSCSVRV